MIEIIRQRVASSTFLISIDFPPLTTSDPCVVVNYIYSKIQRFAVILQLCD